MLRLHAGTPAYAFTPHHHHHYKQQSSHKSSTNRTKPLPPHMTSSASTATKHHASPLCRHPTSPPTTKPNNPPPASRYGGYLVMTLTVAAGQEGAARAFVERLSPHARLTYSVGGTLKFELPSSEVRRGGVREC